MCMCYIMLYLHMYVHMYLHVYVYIYIYMYVYIFIYTPQIKIGLYTPKTVGVGLVYDLGLLIPS